MTALAKLEDALNTECLRLAKANAALDNAVLELKIAAQRHAKAKYDFIAFREASQ